MVCGTNWYKPFLNKCLHFLCSYFAFEINLFSFVTFKHWVISLTYEHPFLQYKPLAQSKRKEYETTGLNIESDVPAAARADVTAQRHKMATLHRESTNTRRGPGDSDQLSRLVGITFVNVTTTSPPVCAHRFFAIQATCSAVSTVWLFFVWFIRCC